jgi:putative GTP pyrophosphokinase
MELARMHDVAGCRLIFQSIEELHEFRDDVHHARFNHILKNDTDKYDYIAAPDEHGYRGIHDVYEFRHKTDGGLLIELQYRT